MHKNDSSEKKRILTSTAFSSIPKSLLKKVFRISKKGKSDLVFQAFIIILLWHVIARPSSFPYRAKDLSNISKAFFSESRSESAVTAAATA